MKISKKQKYNEFRKKGYLIYKTKKRVVNDIKNLTKELKNFKFKNTNLEEKGYSNDILPLLNNNIKFKINLITKNILKENEWVFKSLIFPKIVRTSLYVSSYNEKRSTEPTRAMLWHKDADDVFQHVRMIVPFVSISKKNGRFSCITKEICHKNQWLRDVELIKKLENRSKYVYADRVRVSDKTMRKYYGSKIFDFDSDVGDILFVNTNYCYHKGGQVIKKNEKRIVLMVTIGSITHSWNKIFNIKKKNIKSHISIFFIKVLRNFKRFSLYLSFIGKKKFIYLK